MGNANKTPQNPYRNVFSKPPISPYIKVGPQGAEDKPTGGFDDPQADDPELFDSNNNMVN